MQEKYDIGLALSGGGAKGIAHLGVIKAMEELGNAPQIISGVSAGAIVAALYADGLSPLDIVKFFQESNFFKFIKLGIPRKGLMSTERFYSLLEQTLKAEIFEELNIPIIINATELNAGRNVYFDQGTLIDKLIASASIPIVLNPAEIDGKQYVDGGIFCNMPAKIIRPRCKKLVGVHVNPIIRNGHSDNILEIAERVYHLTIQSNTVDEKQVCDIVIEPKEAKNFGMFEISKSMELFEIGYQTAMKAFEKNPLLS